MQTIARETVLTINQHLDQLGTEISAEHSLAIAENFVIMIESPEARHPKMTLILNLSDR